MSPHGPDRSARPSCDPPPARSRSRGIAFSRFKCKELEAGQNIRVKGFTQVGDSIAVLFQDQAAIRSLAENLTLSGLLQVWANNITSLIQLSMHFTRKSQTNLCEPQDPTGVLIPRNRANVDQDRLVRHLLSARSKEGDPDRRLVMRLKTLSKV